MIALLDRRIPERSNGRWLVMYVIYFSPSDYIDQYVVRRHALRFPGGDRHVDAEPCFVGYSVSVARNTIPDGLVRLDRHLEDDPAVMEVWV